MAKRKLGRPEIILNEDLLEELARIHCTMDEIASVVGCSKDTIERNYMEVIEKGRAKGKSSLRRLQYHLAEAGNATMLVWLGKQLLGQKDKQEIEQTEVRKISDTEKSLLIEFMKDSKTFFEDKK